MHDETAESGATEPWRNAADIARAIGREKRVVLLYFAEGCPHQETGTGKRRTKIAKLSDVKTWVARRGLDVHRPGKAAPEPEPESAPAEPAPELPAADAGPLFASARQAMDAEFSGPVDYDRQLAQVRRKLSELQYVSGAGDGGKLSAGESQRVVAAIAALNKELRMLDQAKHAAELRQGMWIETTKAAASLRQLAELVVAALESIPAAVAAAMTQALEEITDPRHHEAGRRACALAAEAAVAQARARMADEIARALGAQQQGSAA